MSMRITSSVLYNGPTDKTARLVLLAIADSANEAGEAFPSLATMALFSCSCIRTVRGKLRWLELEGWITTSPRVCENGRTTSNLYRINLSRLAIPEPPQKAYPAKIAPPAKSAASPRQKLPPREPAKIAPLEQSERKKGFSNSKNPIIRANARTSILRQNSKTCANALLVRLTEFQLSLIRESKALVIDGQLVEPSTPEHQFLQQMLRNGWPHSA